MRGSRLAAVLLAAVLAIALTACGGDDGDSAGGTTTASGEENTEAGAEAAMIEILTSSDPADCQRMTDAYLDSLYFDSGQAGIETCETSVTENQLTDITVADLSLEGDTATATVTTVLGPAEVGAVYEDGTWKLDSFTASGQ